MIIITTLILEITKTIVIKNEMVNNGNSDDNSRNEENKNNSQKITFAQS